VVILMVLATGYAVAQLAALGLAARTVRVGTLMLAAAAGCYACGVGAVVAEFGYTRVAHAVTGRPLATVVEAASFTVDPVIEDSSSCCRCC
jgi:hypothetical protein